LAKRAKEIPDLASYLAQHADQGERGDES